MSSDSGRLSGILGGGPLTSQASTGTAASLTDTTTYANGWFFWNSDTSLPLVIGLGAATTTPGAGQATLGPGQGIPMPPGTSPSDYKIIAASGAPTCNWYGNP
jgi:hypothetical protein